jgi:hypothetical protein
MSRRQKMLDGYYNKDNKSDEQYIYHPTAGE